jgi:hypothetical protein
MAAHEARRIARLEWRAFSRHAVVFCAALLIVLAIQWQSGCHEAELSSYPDEPAHYVTGVMVRQYLAGGWRQESPIRFAEQYYLHYPKVALGHWPPVFYLAQSIWSAIFPATISAVLYLQAVLTAAIALALFSWSRRSLGSPNAAILAATFLLLPWTQELSSQVMSEPLLTLLSLGAVWAGIDFFLSHRLSSLVWFGALAELAALTKGSGLALFPFLIALGICLRKWSAFRSPGFWMVHAGLVVAYVPWQVLTWKMVRNGMENGFGLELIQRQTIGFLQVPQLIVGVLFTLIIAVGLSLAFCSRQFRDPVFVGCAIFVVSVFAVHCISPNGVEPRRLFMSVPAMLLLGGLVVARVTARFNRVRWTPFVLLAVVLASIAPIFAWTEKPVAGYRQAANWILGEAGNVERAVLVASQVDGEGILIAEIAQRQPRPVLYIARASKIVAESDWNGNDYKLIVQNSEKLQAALDSLPVRYVIADRFPGAAVTPHHQLVLRNIQEHPTLWTQRKAIPAVLPGKRSPGEILIFERTGRKEAGAISLRLDMRRVLGRYLEK